MKNKYGLKSSMKYDWRTIDCKKMPDYNHLGAAGALGFGTEFYTDDFWSKSESKYRNEIYNEMMNSYLNRRAEDIFPMYTVHHVHYSKGFDVSAELINCTEEVANGTR